MRRMQLSQFFYHKSLRTPTRGGGCFIPKGQNDDDESYYQISSELAICEETRWQVMQVDYESISAVTLTNSGLN